MENLQEELQKELENKFIEKNFNLFQDKNTISLLINVAKKDINILRDCYENLLLKKDYLNIYYQFSVHVEEERVILKAQQIESTLTFKDFKLFLVNLIDLFEPIYPLGTVVSLKKEYLNNIFRESEIKEVYFVITHRFISNESTNVYFQYAGVPFPIGNLGMKEFFNFTSPLIDEVIYSGYSNNQEVAFVYMMKRELILEKEYKSIGFASKEERNEFQNLIKK